jgi:uncharacterized protein with von Willebrand factor type A (vWA) domain
MIRYRYSQWDGTQEIPDLNPEELFDALSERLSYDGDVLRALQKLFRFGLEGGMGQRLEGMQDLLQQLRALKRQTLDRYNIGSVLDDIRQRLDDAINTERQGIQRRLEEAWAGRQPEDMVKALENVAANNLAFLDNLPQNLPGQIKEMASYEFIDAEARRQFEELMEMLRNRIMESYFKDMQRALESLTPDDINNLRDMLKSLNQMLQDKIWGREPDFEGFMEKFGDQFGEQRPSSLEELIDMLRKRIAQAESLFNSLPADARRSLEQMVDSLLEYQDLRDEFLDLVANLEYLSGRGKLGTQYQFRGDEPLSLAEALKLMEELQGMDELERQIERAQLGSSLDEIDASRVRHYLGDEALRSLQQLQQLTDVLEKTGYIWKDAGRWKLTPKATRRLGQKALREVFDHLKRGRFGRHEVSRMGVGVDRSDDTKKYEFGDSFLLDVQSTLMNSLRREGVGSPVRLRPQDFEVYETEYLTQCSTVLMLDLSWSMPMRGNFFAAKKVALALDSLIRSQFPRDNLHIVGFSDYAVELKRDALPNITWNQYVYGTNMQHGFMLSRRLLAKHRTGSRQIIMVTDGEPTAHLEGGHAYFDYPPSPRTLQETLREARRCAAEGIVINTFMLDRDPYIKRFVDMLSKANRGRVFYTSPENLGAYLLVDYFSRKRRKVVS